MSKRKTRKTRLSIEPTVLLLTCKVEPNEQHPLFDVDSKRRAHQRQTVIGSVLARLAQASESEQNAVATITQRSSEAN